MFSPFPPFEKGKEEEKQATQMRTGKLTSVWILYDFDVNDGALIKACFVGFSNRLCAGTAYR